MIRQQAASAIQLVVQMMRLRDGSRKISSVAEVTGVSGESVQLEEIFRFERSGMVFVPTGYRPEFLKRLRAAGVEVEL